MVRLTLGVLLFACGCLNAQTASSYEVVDSQGRHWFDAPPERVIATDWTVLENLLELGIEPVGAPEIALFRQLNPSVPVPLSTEDIGLRIAPTLQKIDALKPDLIIIGGSQKRLSMPLSRLARTLYYKSFSSRYRTNGDKALLRFTQIASIFNKRAEAERRLQLLQDGLKQSRDRLALDPQAKASSVVIVRLLNDTQCLVYGPNSLAYSAIMELGLRTPVAGGENTWGEIEMPIADLAQFSDSLLLYFLPLPVQRLPKGWLILPQIISGQGRALPAIWTRGSAMSIGTIADAVTLALTESPG